MKSAKNDSKKSWHKPSLIVLLRNMPEEAVLNSCRSVGEGGPGSDNNNCHLMLQCGTNCDAIATS